MAKPNYENTISVIGMAGRFPGARNLDEFWENLRNGVESIKFFTDEELLAAGIPESTILNPTYIKARGIVEKAEYFDANFFDIPRHAAENMDPQQRVLLETVWHALESSGYFSEDQAGVVSVFASAGQWDSYLWESLNKSGRSESPVENFQRFSQNSLDFLAPHISYAFNFTGPSYTVQSACSTGLLSVSLACQSLLFETSDMAISGTVNIMYPRAGGYFYTDGLIFSPDGHCRPFDSRSHGTLGSEGSGVLVLKRTEDAIRGGDHIFAVIRGFGVNNDGAQKVGFTAPSVDGQSKVIIEAMVLADVEPETISYVEAHGTGTKLGDPIEIKALTQAYRDLGCEKKSYCAIGSLKSNIGHLDVVAGTAGLIKTILAMNHGEIPPSINYQEPNPEIDFPNTPFYVCDKLTPWKKQNFPKRAGVSSFGVGGTNTHVVLEEPPERKTEKLHEDRPHILVLSAKSENALNDLIESYQKYLNETNDSIADICYTANSFRKHFDFRTFVIAKDIQDLKLKLKNRLFTISTFQKTKMEIKIEVTSETNWFELLPQLGEAYSQGVEIDWRKIYEPFIHRKVILPLYPFQRERFWVESSKPYLEDSIDKLYYEWKWEEISLDNINEPLGHWLLLGEGKMAESLVDLIKSRGGTCDSVSRNDHPKTKEEFVQLIQKGSFTGILHFLSSDKGSLTKESIKKNQIFGTESFLYLIQALVQLQSVIKIPVVLITQDSTKVILSPLNGLFKTAIVEHPDLKIRHLDLSEKYEPNSILEGIFSKKDELIMSLKENKWYVPRLTRKKSLEKNDLKFRSDATYLITGGFGGLGLTLAKWLIEKGAGHIVLAGRKELDEIKDNIENLNQQITYVKADISDETAVVNLFNNLNHAQKPLKGIFHLAGVLDDAILMEQDWAHFEKIFASKVYGSYYLHHYSKDLDLFVLFSSISSTLGSPGQSNYAAANSFMDGLCEYRKNLKLPALSISWGPWAEVGMAKDLVSRLAHGGVLALNPNQGLHALEIALNLSDPVITIADINWESYLKQQIKIPSWLHHFIEKKGKKATLFDMVQKGQKEEQFSLIKNYVNDVVRSVIGLSMEESIDEKMGFSDMGLDSLMAVEAKNRLQSNLGGEYVLSSTVVFDYPTIDKMSHHIAQLLQVEDKKVKQNIETLEEARKAEIRKDIGAISMDEVLKRLRGKL